MNILVTGANGQLGNEMRILARQSRDSYVFTDVSQVEGFQTEYLDITDLQAVRAAVAEHGVQAIVPFKSSSRAHGLLTLGCKCESKEKNHHKSKSFGIRICPPKPTFSI